MKYIVITVVILKLLLIQHCKLCRSLLKFYEIVQ